MSIDLLIMISFALLILALLVWAYIIIGGIQNKIANHTKSFDKLMQVNYQLTKDLNDLKKQVSQIETNITTLNSKGAAFTLDEITRRIDARINEALASRVMPMLDSLRNLENSVDNFASEHDERILDLEERTKSIRSVSPPSFSAEEDRIEALFRKGKNAEGIARELHITVGKVNMVLRLKHLI